MSLSFQKLGDFWGTDTRFLRSDFVDSVGKLYSSVGKLYSLGSAPVRRACKTGKTVQCNPLARKHLREDSETKERCGICHAQGRSNLNARGNLKDLDMSISVKPFCAALSLAVLVIVQQASALPLAPGVTIFADPELDPVGGVVLASLTDTFVGGTAPNDFAGSITSTVIAGGVNPLGGLTFTYRFSIDADSATEIGRLTVEGYAGFLVDASFQIPVGLGIPPGFIDRSSAAGDVVGFIFLSPPFGGRVGPGEMSALLVLQTDATTWAPNEGNIINGATAEVEILAPGVPDGGTTLLLLGSALLGIEAFRRKFRLKS